MPPASWIAPPLGGTSQAQIARLVESNDLEILRALATTGEINLAAQSDTGCTAAFLAIEYDRPAVLTREFPCHCKMHTIIFDD